MSRESKPKSKYRVQGISFPNEALYQAALKKAQTERRSLSNYICGLLEEDLINETLELRNKAVPESPAEDCQNNDKPAAPGRTNSTVKGALDSYTEDAWRRRRKKPPSS